MLGASGYLPNRLPSQSENGLKTRYTPRIASRSVCLNLIQHEQRTGIHRSVLHPVGGMLVNPVDGIENHTHFQWLSVRHCHVLVCVVGQKVVDLTDRRISE